MSYPFFRADYNFKHRTLCIYERSACLLYETLNPVTATVSLSRCVDNTYVRERMPRRPAR